jgi:hypothetical protein
MAGLGGLGNSYYKKTVVGSGTRGTYGGATGGGPTIYDPAPPPPTSGGGGGGGMSFGGGGGGGGSSTLLSSLSGGPAAGSIRSVTTIPGAGAGSGFQDMLSKLLAQLQGSSDAANAAGLDQYKNLLGTVDALPGRMARLYNQAGAHLDTLGASGMARIADQETQNRGKAEQDLISRGLGNTTIRQNVLGGVSRDAERSRQELGEGLAAQKVGLLERRAGADMDLGRLKADAILSRQNEGPDMGMFLNLIQQLSRTMGQG